MEPFEPRVERAATFPARFYRDPNALRDEIERVFFRTWQWVGRVDQVREAGDYFTTDVQGEPLLVVRGADGVLRCFFNVCRHRAGPVASGSGRCETFQCRYHAWTYGLDGRLRSAPGLGRVEGFAVEDQALPLARLATWQGLVFVNLAPDGPSLDDFLGPLPKQVAHLQLEKMRVAARQEYTLSCNWKIYVDNFMEGYHLENVHVLLRGRLDYDSYRVDPFRYCSEHHLLAAPPPPGSVSTPQEAHRFWVFPNLRLNIYPDSYSLNLVLPLDHERTRVIFDWYYPNPQDPALQPAIKEMLDLSDAIQQEDVTICEAVQRGVRSRSYDRGRYSTKFERGLHHFHGLLTEFLTR